MNLANMAIALRPAPLAFIVAADICPRVGRHNPGPVTGLEVAVAGVCEAALGEHF